MNIYQVNQIADWFLAAINREAGDTISHLKLQKLMYYAQAWSLALNHKSLFNEDFEAWTEFDWNSIPPEVIFSNTDKLTQEDEELLFDILNSYGDLSAKHLEELTHLETPWRNARGNIPLEARSTHIISKEIMQEYYQKLYKEVDDE